MSSAQAPPGVGADRGITSAVLLSHLLRSSSTKLAFRSRGPARICLLLLCKHPFPLSSCTSRCSPTKRLGGLRRRMEGCAGAIYNKWSTFSRTIKGCSTKDAAHAPSTTPPDHSLAPWPCRC
eukprot:9335046-Pyramimonas_sp.AAC.1